MLLLKKEGRGWAGCMPGWGLVGAGLCTCFWGVFTVDDL